MAKDNILHQDYYGGDTVYEAIKVITAWGLTFNTGNAAKYISRAGKKEPAKEIEDLKKARNYITFEIERLEKANGPAEREKDTGAGSWLRAPGRLDGQRPVRRAGRKG